MNARRARRVAVPRIAVVVLVVLSGTACGLAPAPPTPAVGCPEALVRGTLEVLGGEIGLFDSTDRHLIVQWPAGYATRDVGGEPSLVDPSGRVVARAGDAVEIPGGEIRVGEWFACGDPLLRIVAPAA